MIPLLTLINSMKFESVVESIRCFAKVNSTFNLSAPVAFSFELPCALSNSVESVAEPTKVSAISKPTL